LLQEHSDVRSLQGQRAGPLAAQLGMLADAPIAEGAAAESPLDLAPAARSPSPAEAAASAAALPEEESGVQPGIPSWTLLSEMEREADARVQREMDIAEQIRKDNARLQDLRKADTQALDRFRDTTAEMKRENSGLRAEEQRSLTELKWLREKNAQLRYDEEVGHAAHFVGRAPLETVGPDGVAVVGEPPAAAVADAAVAAGAGNASAAADAAASPAPVVPWPGKFSESHTFFALADDLATLLDAAEHGELPRPVMELSIVLAVFIASCLVVYACQHNVLEWDLLSQLLWLGVFCVDSGLVWGYAIAADASSLVFASTMIILPMVYFVGRLWTTFKSFDGADLDGDGDVDWHDRLEAFKKTGQSMSLFMGTVSELLPLMVMGFGGFAFLWYLGYLQPVMKTLVVYMYCASLMIAVVIIFIFKIWSNLNQSIMQFFEQFKMFQHQAEDIIQELPEHVSKLVETMLRGGDPDVEPPDDMTLANLYHDPFLTKEHTGAGLADVSHDPFLATDAVDRRKSLALICDFAEALFDKYKDTNDAFAAMDTSKNGALSKAEFCQGARQLPNFKGNASAVFKCIESNTKGKQGRVTKREFRQLQDAHEQQVDAKSKLEQATKALNKAMHNMDVKVESLFQMPDAGSSSPSHSGRASGAGAVWFVRKAIDNAKAKAVAGVAFLEVQHTLEEAQVARGLELAMEGGDRGELENWIRVAQEKQVPRLRIQAAQVVLGGAGDARSAGPAKKRAADT